MIYRIYKIVPDVVVVRSRRRVPYWTVAYEPITPNLKKTRAISLPKASNPFEKVSALNCQMNAMTGSNSANERFQMDSDRIVLKLFVTLMAGRMIWRSSPRRRLLGSELVLLSSCSFSSPLQRSSRMLKISRETIRAHSCHAERYPPSIRESKQQHQKCNGNEWTIQSIINDRSDKELTLSHNKNIQKLVTCRNWLRLCHA